jgi:rhamnogalacturonan endolyase
MTFRRMLALVAGRRLKRLATRKPMNLRFIFWLLVAGSVAAPARAANPVVVSDNEPVANIEPVYMLDNGIVSARVSKLTGDLLSLKYKDLEMLDDRSSRGNAYWSHDTSRGDRITRITIDPQINGGERGEVSIKGIAHGRPMGSGPGGSVTADIEIRYTLNRGDSGIYTYSIFSHPTNYPSTSVGEARFCAKLNDSVFDWMTVDANRDTQVITTYDWNHGVVMNMKEARRMTSGIYRGEVEHKYDYSANQFETLAWGWSSSAKQVGLWFVNPTTEYLSGGPTKVELSAHRDATFGNNPNAPAPPCLLNYWRGSHYGGSVCSIAEGEAWTKVIGPFLIYCNTGKNHDAMWKDALARSARESKAWPFDWVSGVDYPNRLERSVVTGQLSLDDPQAPKLKLTHLLVGLSAPDYTPRSSRGGGGFGGGPGLAGGGEDETAVTGQNVPPGGPRGGADDSANTNATPSARGRRGGGRGGGGFGGFGPRAVGWQEDAKYYQFWVRGDSRGEFAIPNVRPGHYTLHALSDGVLGEFTLTNVTVVGGKFYNLGKLDWQPVRYGRQLWDIGIPNRKGSEFFKGDDYFHWGWYLEYPKLFPNDVNYIVGTSDYRKDWFFEQVPHNENPTNTTGTGSGRSTTWSITFQLPELVHGKATLRLALCGIGTRSIAATVNDQSIGTVTGLTYNATINRDGIGGTCTERDLTFDASMMRAGENVLKLTIPAGGLMNGVIYDYIRLELDEAAAPPTKLTAAAAGGF